MGKGTKKKTVWRTFSFENGYTNGTNDADTNGLTASSHHQKNGKPTIDLIEVETE